jgi:hypothetical protein
MNKNDRQIKRKEVYSLGEHLYDCRNKSLGLSSHWLELAV